MRLILASGSPRRKELLERLNIDFEIIPPNIEEHLDDTLVLEDAVIDLAWQKASYIKDKQPDAKVLGCDTIVVYEGQVLGKPKDAKDAFKMLSLLSGNTHRVITGCVYIDRGTIKKFYRDAYVTFSLLNEDEIQWYIDTKEPFGKAGAYAIQGLGGRFIENLRGDYYAVMGLPLQAIYNECIKGIA